MKILNAFTDAEKAKLAGLDGGLSPRIDAVLATNLVLDTSLEEKVIPFDTVVRSVGITLSAGAFTMPKDGRYVGSLTLQIDEDSDPTFILWTEVKPLSTGVWVLAGGLRKTKIKDDTYHTITLAGSMELLDGDQIRISAMVLNGLPDKVTLKEVSQVLSLGTALQPAAALSIDWIGGLTT